MAVHARFRLLSLAVLIAIGVWPGGIGGVGSARAAGEARAVDVEARCWYLRGAMNHFVFHPRFLELVQPSDHLTIGRLVIEPDTGGWFERTREGCTTTGSVTLWFSGPLAEDPVRVVEVVEDVLDGMVAAVRESGAMPGVEREEVPIAGCRLVSDEGELVAEVGPPEVTQHEDLWRVQFHIELRATLTPQGAMPERPFPRFLKPLPEGEVLEALKDHDSMRQLRAIGTSEPVTDEVLEAWFAAIDAAAEAGDDPRLSLLLEKLAFPTHSSLLDPLRDRAMGGLMRLVGDERERVWMPAATTLIRAAVYRSDVSEPPFKGASDRVRARFLSAALSIFDDFDSKPNEVFSARFFAIGFGDQGEDYLSTLLRAVRAEPELAAVLVSSVRPNQGSGAVDALFELLAEEDPRVWSAAADSLRQDLTPWTDRSGLAFVKFAAASRELRLRALTAQAGAATPERIRQVYKEMLSEAGGREELHRWLGDLYTRDHRRGANTLYRNVRRILEGSGDPAAVPLLIRGLYDDYRWGGLQPGNQYGSALEGGYTLQSIDAITGKRYGPWAPGYEPGLRDLPPDMDWGKIMAELHRDFHEAGEVPVPLTAEVLRGRVEAAMRERAAAAGGGAATQPATQPGVESF